MTGPSGFSSLAWGRERFAIPLAAVDEAIDSPDVRRMPDAGPTVLSVGEVRRGADLIAILDVDALLDAAMDARQAQGDDTGQ